MSMDRILHERVEPAERAGPAKAAGEQDAELEGDRGRPVKQLRQQAAQLLVPQTLADAEHRAEDHLERDGLHVRVQRERLARRPGGDVALGGLGDHVLVRRHPPPVERRQHELAAAQMLSALEQQHGLRAHHRLQRQHASDGQPVVAVGVDRPHRVGVGHDHQRCLEAEELDAERVAESPATRFQERDRPGEPVHGLHHR
jgi:hypothetical protein